jgi:hypothetical protein
MRVRLGAVSPSRELIELAMREALREEMKRRVLAQRQTYRSLRITKQFIGHLRFQHENRASVSAFRRMRVGLRAGTGLSVGLIASPGSSAPASAHSPTHKCNPVQQTDPNDAPPCPLATHGAAEKEQVRGQLASRHHLRAAVSLIR